LEGIPVKHWKLIGAILTLLAVFSLTAWPLWKWLILKEASARLKENTRALVEKNPQLRPDWDKAMEDGVLTKSEAKAIFEKAGQKMDPEE
jgi:hypothetical protein